jgi:two-component system, NarL family, nitrate/nitrite response regulator NarL
MRIVICDAHRVFADALTALLRTVDHRVVGSALDLCGLAVILQRELVDVCVAELRCLPQEHRRMEQVINSSSGTAFVGLSASADPTGLRQALAAGFRGLSLKDDDFDEILGVLTSAAGGMSCGRAEPAVLSASVRAALRCGGLQAGLGQFLTEREREVLTRLVRGESTQDMAHGMGVRICTARTHIEGVMSKLGAHSRPAVMAYAVREGLVDLGHVQHEPAMADDDAGQAAHRR